MIVIGHNPECGTSRDVPAGLRAAAGAEPVVPDCTARGWTRPPVHSPLPPTVSSISEGASAAAFRSGEGSACTP